VLVPDTYEINPESTECYSFSARDGPQGSVPGQEEGGQYPGWVGREVPYTIRRCNGWHIALLRPFWAPTVGVPGPARPAVHRCADDATARPGGVPAVL